MSTTSEQLNDAVEKLREALSAVEAERAEFETRVATLREAYERRAAYLESTIKGLGETFGPITEDAGEPEPEEEPDAPPLLSVSSTKLQAIRDHVMAHPKGVRQADITKNMGMNAGTVSVALRRLERDRVLVRGAKRRASALWMPYVEARDRDREIVVRPGEGVSQGRRVAIAS